MHAYILHTFVQQNFTKEVISKMFYFSSSLVLAVFHTVIQVSKGSVGGILAERNEFPVVVVLMNGAEQPMCGGILVTTTDHTPLNYIVTSQSCYISDSYTTKIPVYAGVLDSSRLEITMQRGFLNHSVPLAVIGVPDPLLKLYRLQTPFIDTEFVTSREIQVTNRQSLDFDSGVLVGWGNTNVRNKPPSSAGRKLRKANLSLISSEECGNYTSIIPPESRFCAGKKSGGIGGCGADTGSPFLYDRNGDASRWGGILYDGGCGKPRKYDVYVAAPYYFDAIANAIHEDSQNFP